MTKYQEALEPVKDIDNALFPKWLFEPVFNDFDDNYYERSFADTALISSIKKLRRRYNDFFEWAEACEIYEEYMNSMIEKYGSKRMLMNAIKADTVNDPIPAKPKLKPTRKNKQFIRAGIIPSQQIYEIRVTREDLILAARDMFPDHMGDTVDEEESHRKLSKKERELVEKMQQKVASNDRRANLYRSVGNNRGTDFIVNYLNQTKRGIYGSVITSSDSVSLSDAVKELEKIENIPPELLEDESLGRTTVKYHGTLISRKEDQKMDLYKKLYEQGFDIIGSLGKTMDKQAVKMVRRNIGATEPATKKELKKLKKRQKKDQRIVERRRDANNNLERVLLGNKLDGIERDENGTLTMRLRDLYRD